MAIRVARTRLGKQYAHFWRAGQVYESFHSESFLAEWTNIKHAVLPYHRHGPVHYRDCRQSLDVADNTFDAAYVFHVLEHMTREQGRHFIAELARIMRPGAILRISSPDLAALARVYLECLEKVSADSSEPNLMNYEWASAHLFDQMVRDQSGGRMIELLTEERSDPEFMQRAFGDVFLGISDSKTVPRLRPRRSLSLLIYGIIRRARLWMSGSRPDIIGELDKWAYDQFSLHQLVEDYGFSDFRIVSHDESSIEDWDSFRFDSSKLGNYAFEPSLYVESRLL